MVDEIRHRFTMMKISEKCLNSKVRMREKDTNLDNPDAIMILKTCIGGAFYGKYVKGVYKNDEMQVKLLNSPMF
jgi:hypothetical protein